MRFRGPLADSYPAAVALVVFALVPYLALSSAITPLTPVLSKSLPLSKQALQLTTGMANAAYAFGTVLAVQFAVHLRGRRMLVLYATLSVLGSVMAALAPVPGVFVAGHILQGLTTSLMLIAAVPPLVTGWPPAKMPWTAITMNLCVFGALFRTRFVPLLALGGLIMLAAGSAVLTGVVGASDAIVLVGSALVGLGVGSSVSPALFIAGFSLRSTQIQRVFALVELLRGFAAFIAAPLLLHLAMTVSSSPQAGIGTAVWVCSGIAAAAALVAASLFALGRARLQRPDLERWEQGEEPAWESPPLLAGVRRRRGTRRSLGVLSE